MAGFNEKYNEYVEYFNDGLNRIFDKDLTGTPNLLKDAITYAVKDGGKRIRPVLCLAAADMLKVDKSEVINFAVAVELIHSYSLVHDDLPSMDNDDYRRGKLSTHKKFGEAYGILAGDALLNLAVEVALNKENFSKNDALATKILFNLSGANGMIAGQVLDLQNENSEEISDKILFTIFENKTSKLLTAPLLIASILSDNKYFSELELLGKNLGLLFQIKDDILDETGDFAAIGKTPHKDEKANKLTSIKVFGLDGAKKIAEILYSSCKEILNKIPNSEFLSELIDRLYTREK